MNNPGRPSHASAPPRRASGEVSLATKILLGLVLNLALIGALLAAVLIIQLRLRPDWLLAGRAGERLQAAAELIADDLARTDRARWDDVLNRYIDAYRIEFILLDVAGTRMAGASPPLPEEILRRLGGRGRLSPGLGGAGQRGGPQGPRAPWAEGTTNATAPPPAIARSRRNANSDRTNQRILYPRFVVRAGNPPAYWAVIRLPAPPRSGPGLALVAHIESPWRGGLLLDAWPWVLAGLGTIAVSALFWLPFVRRITRDVRRMTDRTAMIAAGRFDDRLELDRADELGRLAASIDTMAARLSDHVSGQRRFLGDAAHELCSPLARLRASVALLEAKPQALTPQRLQDIAEELEEMASLVDELLAFSRAAHGRSVRLHPVSVEESIARAWQRESAGRGRLESLVSPNLQVLADSTLLVRALGNLFRNALRYAGEASPVHVLASIQGDRVELRIRDEGPGVPHDALPHLFEPFYRPEASRNRDFGGAGLGLAIVRSCLDACGGTASARNVTPRGFEVCLQLTHAHPTQTATPQNSPELPGSA